MLFGLKEILSFLEITRDRIPTFIAEGAPIKRLGRKNGVRYMANRQALLDWICCRDTKARAGAKAG
jgi:hypothetical protein